MTKVTAASSLLLSRCSLPFTRSLSLPSEFNDLSQLRATGSLDTLSFQSLSCTSYTLSFHPRHLRSASMSLPLPSPLAGLTASRPRERRLPVPIRESAFQRRLAAAASPRSPRPQCHSSQSSLASPVAAPSQLEPSQRDFSLPQPVTLPNLNNQPSAIAALPERPAISSLASAQPMADMHPQTPPGLRLSPLVSPDSAAAAANVAILRTTPLSLSLRSAATSQDSVAAERSLLATQPNSMAPPALPSPPPFVSKHHYRQRAVPAVDRTQPAARDNADVYSQRVEVTTAQYSSTTPSLPPASQLLPSDLDHGTRRNAVSMQPPSLTASEHVLGEAVSAGSFAQADGGYKLHSAVHQQQMVAALQAGHYCDPSLSLQYVPPSYLSHYPLYYPSVPNMQPLADARQPAANSRKHRRRPASPASSDVSFTGSSSSDDSDNDSSQPAARPRRMSLRRIRARKEAVEEYKDIYRQHKKLLLTSPAQPYSTASINQALSKRQLLQVSQCHQPTAPYSMHALSTLTS